MLSPLEVVVAAPVLDLLAIMAPRALAEMHLVVVAVLEVMVGFQGVLGLTATTTTTARVVAVLAGVSLFSGKNPLL